MRTLFVSKHLKFWTVRYLKNGANPAWPLKSLAIKTHGLVSYPDLLFTIEEEAVDYAKTIAENLNYHYDQPYTNIFIQELPILPGKTIQHSEKVSVDLAHVDYKTPATEINDFSRIHSKKA
jgi:hypothetical protein